MPIDPLATRGYLNNNPGNMDRSDPPWVGEIRNLADCKNDVQRMELEHGRFCVFVDADHGIRAMVKNLWAYRAIGLDTINGLINRWAPPNENNTIAYKDRVSLSTGKGLDEHLDMDNRATMRALLDGIIRVECGGMPYAGSEIENWMTLAGMT